MRDLCEYGGGSHKGHRPQAAAGERKQQQRAAADGGEQSAHHAQLPGPRPSERHLARAEPKGPATGGVGWGLFASDAEAKRRRRVAGYKTYAVGGKVKASVRQGIRWIKGKCSGLVHGW